MAASNLQRLALQALVTLLEEAVPELDGRGGVGQADEEETAALPWFRVVAGFFQVDLHQGADDEVDTTEAAADEDGNPGRIVVEVGRLVGDLSIHLATRYQPERERLQAALLAALAGDEERRGVTLVQLGALETAGGATLYHATAGFELSGSGWRDEFAFTKEPRAVLDLAAQIPILVDREVAGTIDTLVGFLALDLDTPPADLVYADVVQVDEDGNLDPFEP